MDAEEGGTTRRGRGRGRGTTRGRAASTRARGRGRGRGRKAKVNIESDEETMPEQSEIENAVVAVAVDPSKQEETRSAESEPASTVLTTPAPEQPLPVATDEKENEILPPTIDMEADISQLEAPTFTTISRGPPEPMLRLKWDHKVSLIGEKVTNPMIHCCDQCDKPILIYGRMIPCKHVFCLRCARIIEPIKLCPRCKEKVLRVEQSGLGTVFMCTHGGSRYGNTGCRRTYLSQRDLQAHINHRHVCVTDVKGDSTKLPPTQRKGSISSDSVVHAPFGLQQQQQQQQQPQQQQQQSILAAPLNLSQTTAHNLPTSVTSSTSSSSYYSSFNHHHNSMSREQNQHNLHYSNASRNSSSYDSGTHSKSNLDSSRR